MWKHIAYCNSVTYLLSDDMQYVVSDDHTNIYLTMIACGIYLRKLVFLKTKDNLLEIVLSD